MVTVVVTVPPVTTGPEPTRTSANGPGKMQSLLVKDKPQGPFSPVLSRLPASPPYPNHAGAFPGFHLMLQAGRDAGNARIVELQAISVLPPARSPPLGRRVPVHERVQRQSAQDHLGHTAVTVVAGVDQRRRAGGRRLRVADPAAAGCRAGGHARSSRSFWRARDDRRVHMDRPRTSPAVGRRARSKVPGGYKSPSLRSSPGIPPERHRPGMQ